MNRWALLIISLLAVVSLGWAQAVVTNSGQATTQGPAVTAAPVSGPVLVTPIVHLGVAAPSAGATNATAGTAGATNATVQQVQPPSSVSIIPEINLGQGTVYQVPIPESAAAPSTAVVLVGNPTGSMTAGATAAAFDRGVSAGTPWQPGTGIGDRSLGEVARDYRQQVQNAHARTYTNQDVERLANQGVGLVGGTSGTAVSSGSNAYPANNGVITNTPAVAQPTQPNTAQPGVAQPSSNGMPITTSPQPPANNQAQPPPASNQNQAAPTLPPASEMAQANVPPAPGSEQNAQGGAQNNRRELPRSASLLPLIAAVGILATGAGLLAR